MYLCAQLFVPLLSPHLTSPSATAEPAGAHSQRQHPVAGVFTLLEEVAMRQAGGLTGDDIDRGIGQPLEQHGVSLTFGGCRLHAQMHLCASTKPRSMYHITCSICSVFDTVTVAALGG